MIKLWSSAVGKKIVMAITGLIMIAYLIGHMAGNLLVFRGSDAINNYAHFLHTNVGPLWIARVVLIAAVVLHVVAVVQLYALDKKARPQAYADYKPQASTFASRTMRIGGLIIFVFIVFHILHFTTGTIQPAPYEEGQVYANVVGSFQIWWVTALYVVAMIAVGAHLYHGGWSWLRTLGLARAKANPLNRPIAAALAIILWAGFTAIPLAIFFGLVR